MLHGGLTTWSKNLCCGRSARSTAYGHEDPNRTLAGKQSLALLKVHKVKWSCPAFPGIFFIDKYFTQHSRTSCKVMALHLLSGNPRGCCFLRIS